MPFSTVSKGCCLVSAAPTHSIHIVVALVIVDQRVQCAVSGAGLVSSAGAEVPGRLSL